jgi:rhodanese-related sulfurtransferase
MKTLNLMTVAASLFLAVGVARASETEKFKLIHVNDLVSDLQTGHPMIFDANNSDTRQKDGVIPGAKLLSGMDYSVVKELPSDKSADLVFYCANTKCMASHSAAGRATAAGYTHVSVLADGIQGWKAAGQKTAQP